MLVRIITKLNINNRVSDLILNIFRHSLLDSGAWDHATSHGVTLQTTPLCVYSTVRISSLVVI